MNRNRVGELACTITQIGFDPYNGCEKDANDGPDITESDGTNFSDNEYESTIITANYDTENFLLPQFFQLVFFFLIMNFFVLFFILVGHDEFSMMNEENTFDFSGLKK